MNFISTFEELNKLYEEAAPEVEKEEAEKEEVVKEGCDKKLTEAAEDEVVEDEISVEEVPAEEPVAEEEPRRVILECDKCGALVIKDEADVAVDEESDLVNVEDECEFCEEVGGYKIVGVVAPYEIVSEVKEVVEDEIVEESLKKYDEEDLEELFDANVKLDARELGGSGNDVSVL